MDLVCGQEDCSVCVVHVCNHVFWQCVCDFAQPVCWPIDGCYRAVFCGS